MKIERLEINRAERCAFSFADDHYIAFRDRLAEAQNWHCCYCGVVMNRWRKTPERCTIEHVIPANAGGPFCWDNCAAACEKCNKAGGEIIGVQGDLPLTLPLCVWCGSDQIRTTIRHAIKCLACAHQWRPGLVDEMPLRIVPYRALRLVAGRIIVASEAPEQMTSRLSNLLRTGFRPVALADALYRVAHPVAQAALAETGSAVEAYWLAEPQLRDRYTPKTPAAPERGPLRRT